MSAILPNVLTHRAVAALDQRKSHGNEKWQWPLDKTRHDDITYESIGKAFNLPLKLHQGAFEKMKKLSKPHPTQGAFDWNTPSPALTAKLRMVELPTDDSREESKQFIFPHEDLWVPVAVVNGNVHILPGVPRLCMDFDQKLILECPS